MAQKWARFWRRQPPVNHVLYVADELTDEDAEWWRRFACEAMPSCFGPRVMCVVSGPVAWIPPISNHGLPPVDTYKYPAHADPARMLQFHKPAAWAPLTDLTLLTTAEQYRAEALPLLLRVARRDLDSARATAEHRRESWRQYVSDLYNLTGDHPQDGVCVLLKLRQLIAEGLCSVCACLCECLDGAVSACVDVCACEFLCMCACEQSER